MRVVLFVLLDILWKVPALFLTPIFLLLFSKEVKDTRRPSDRLGGKRAKYPKWLSWAETKDELMCGDLTIPTVKYIHEKFGWFITSWYWLGVRNTGSLLWYVGKPAPTYLDLITEDQKKEYGIWYKEIPLVFLELRVGWNIYRDWYSTFTEGGFWATPYISFRVRKHK